MFFNELGYELINDFISHDELTAVIDETESALHTEKGGGIRNAEKKFASVLELTQSPQIIKHAGKFLTNQPALVRAILFDKRPEKNWLVTWHQDKSIALSNRFNKSGWGPWSMKDGIHNVQPPQEVLEQMITFRIHLDESTAKSGCLKLLPKTHSLGILSQKQISQYANTHSAKIIEAPARSALAMRPLILHASSKAEVPTMRRVLHLEYSDFELPVGVSWA
ncbi:phytanoyl-CoA dioxygenase family protein [Simiduia litorea]|uniref:phytanoyl-CoA dioxygenase family protein n=1 Tax=Simiduia litorea TaxID=1435348 RepID=UPI0036F3830A